MKKIIKNKLLGKICDICLFFDGIDMCNCFERKEKLDMTKYRNIKIPEEKTCKYCTTGDDLERVLLSSLLEDT